MRIETKREFWLRLLREFEEREQLIQKLDANNLVAVNKDASDKAA
jgi:hypothetical protein